VTLSQHDVLQVTASMVHYGTPTSCQTACSWVQMLASCLVRSTLLCQILHHTVPSYQGSQLTGYGLRCQQTECTHTCDVIAVVIELGNTASVFACRLYDEQISKIQIVYSTPKLLSADMLCSTIQHTRDSAAVSSASLPVTSRMSTSTFAAQTDPCLL